MKTKNKKANKNNILWKICFLIPTFIFIIIGVFILLLNLYAIYKVNNKVSPILLILIPIFLFIVLFLGEKIVKHKKINIILKILILTSLFVFIFFIGFKTRVGLFNTWDYGQLIRSAFSIIQEDELYNRPYFIRYPNNTILLQFEILLCIIGNMYNSAITLKGIQSITILVNVIITFINIITTSMIFKKITKQKNNYITYILILLFAPFYLYATILYTDSIGMLLNLIALLLYYSLNNTESSKIKKLLFFLLALDIVIGFKFKATNIFILIAIAIDLLTQKEFKNIFKLVILTILVLIPVNLTLNTLFKVTEAEKEAYEFPYTHWIMMTLNPKTEGGYNEDDVKYTKSFDTIQKRKEANIDKIKERINYFGPVKLIKRILITKNIRTWTNPTLGTSDYLGRHPAKKNFINETVTLNGKHFNKYIKYLNSLYIIMWILIIISAIYNIEDKNSYVFISQLMIVGIFLFELIWECNSRYLYSFLPFMITLASYSLIKLKDTLLFFKDNKLKRLAN